MREEEATVGGWRAVGQNGKQKTNGYLREKKKNKGSEGKKMKTKKRRKRRRKIVLPRTTFAHT